MPQTLAPACWRLFVAVLVPPEVRTEIERAQAELRRVLPRSRVAWTRREQLHLTLKFLGDVEASRAGAVAEALRRVAAGFAPLRLRAAGLGFFPDPRRPRVGWIGVWDEAEQLPRLAEAVTAAVAEFASEAREERFAGHVTLARIKELFRSEAGPLAQVARARAGQVC